MSHKHTPLPNHAVAYGLVVLILLAGAGLALLIYEIILAWEVESLERVTFAVMLLVGLPMFFLFDWGAPHLAKAVGLSEHRLLFCGKTMLFATYMTLTHPREFEAAGPSVLQYFGYLCVYALFGAAIFFVWDLFMACRKHKKEGGSA